MNTRCSTLSPCNSLKLALPLVCKAFCGLFGVCLVFASLLPASAAPLNAWSVSGSYPTYYTNLTPALQVTATNQGWHCSVGARVVDLPYASGVMTFGYDDHQRRYQISLSLDQAGNLMATTYDANFGTITRTLTANGWAADAYHTHELTYNSLTRQATYRFDGVAMVTWPGFPSADEPWDFLWRSYNFAAWNFNKVSFDITGLGVVASYDAGMQGNPPTAPDPATIGWSLESYFFDDMLVPLSPDWDAVRPLVRTLPVQLLASGARLNGRVNPHASATLGWFEWGTDTNYGNVTAARSLGSGRAPTNFSETLTGLTVDTTYHFRAVASNSFGIVVGGDDVFAPRFAEVSVTLPNFGGGAPAWGDYDGDGDLDVAFTGTTNGLVSGIASRIYRNDGGTNFVALSASLQRVWGRSVWADFDSDGDLDLLISGDANTSILNPIYTPITKVYRNIGGGSFVDMNASGLAGVAGVYALNCEDFDNDGARDIFLQGQDTNGLYVSRIYRNQSGTNFLAATTNLDFVDWADFDADGDLDPLSRRGIHWNEAGMNFDLVLLGGLGFQDYIIGWWDSDHDGDPDILVWDGEEYVTRVYQNQGERSFARGGPFSWIGGQGLADYDNDGDLDSFSYGTLVRNDGGTNFVDSNASPISGDVWSAYGAWGDFDNDGDVDLLASYMVITNYDTYTGYPLTKLFQNDGPLANSPPSAPTGLTAQMDPVHPDRVRLRWNPAQDNQAPQAALSYNLVFSTVSNAANIASPMADLGSGYRRVVQFGAASGQRVWNFKGLPAGRYYWSVQAIDTALAGGPFAPIQVFDGGGPAPAWQITDNSPAEGSVLFYSTNLTLGRITASTNRGWAMTLTARLFDDFGGIPTMSFGYSDGTRRFDAVLDLDASGNLVATLPDDTPGGLSLALTTGGLGARQYHTHELVFSPSNRMATYRFDGIAQTQWGGQSNTNTPGRMHWGATSSGGMGQLNVRAVRYEVLPPGPAVLHTYNAGSLGSPAAANPVGQGWTLTLPTAPGTATTNGLPVDDTIYPPGPPAVNTLPANMVTTTTARLSAEANPHNATTFGWFEWGASASYGSTTELQVLGAGGLPVGFEQSLSGLAGGVTYHFRAVVSNSFGQAVGTDRSFTTAVFDQALALPPVAAGPAAWGDYDNDGDLDILQAGLDPDDNRVSTVYRNDGALSFLDVTGGLLPPLGVGMAAWGDFSQDGALDFMLAGSPGFAEGRLSRLFLNSGADTFTDLGADIPGASRGGADWGDFDNDGDLDLLFSGVAFADGTNYHFARIYRNEDGTHFADIHATLPEVAFGSGSWGDFDNDGDLDILLTGSPVDPEFGGPIDGAGVTKIFRNDGGTNFTDLEANLEGVFYGSAAWGDYDNDGDLDVVVVGAREFNFVRVGKIYRNDGGTNFVPLEADIEPLELASAAWGDFDNDGDLDLLVSGGAVAFFPVTKLYRNDGAHIFVDISLTGLTGGVEGAASWGDYDGDSRLDLLLCGFDGSSFFTQIYQNRSPEINVPPSAPTGLSAQWTGDSLTLAWDASTDDHTPAPGLTYNLVVSTTPDGIDLVSPMADLNSGQRRIVKMGGVNHNLSWTLRHLPPAPVYYWSVQAIDTAFAGGPFAPRQTIAAGPRITDVVLTPGGLRLRGLGAPGQAYRVEATSDFEAWSTLATRPADGGGVIEFTDGDAIVNPQRFYRLATP